MLKIAKEEYEKIIEHCRKEYPKEACGILGGIDGVVKEVYAMKNVDASPISYTMDPKEQLQVMNKLHEASSEWLAVYHSHTATDAYPSTTDVSLSVSPDISYVLVSLKDKENPQLRSYRISDNEINPEDVQLEK